MANSSRKFKSSTGEVVRVALSSGAVALIGNDWGGLPPQFHKGAYAQGCISDDMVANTVEERINPNIVATLNRVANKKDKIRTTILSWLKENKLEKFFKPTGGGDWQPRAQALSSDVGERVSKQERNEVWYKLLEEGIQLPEFE